MMQFLQQDYCCSAGRKDDGALEDAAWLHARCWPLSNDWNDHTRDYWPVRFDLLFHQAKEFDDSVRRK
jgi:hypothetical protein